MKRLKIILALALIAFTLAACGGGGGGGDAGASPGSSNWDSMVWDQDNWS